MAAVDDISDEQFEREVIQSKIPVFIDFHASWCGPCKSMAPAIHAVAEEFKGRVRVVKIDVDACPVVTRRYDVRSMPTFLVIQGGEKSERYSGTLTPRKLLSIFGRLAGASE